MHDPATSTPVADAGADYSPPSTPDYKEDSDAELTEAFNTLQTGAEEAEAPAAPTSPQRVPRLFQPPRRGSDDEEYLRTSHLPLPREVVRELFWQHAGRLPEQHELDPVLEYFLPLYRSAILNVEIIIRSYLIDQGEVEPYEDDEELISEAGSDVTRATESSESICDETDDTPAQ